MTGQQTETALDKLIRMAYEDYHGTETVLFAEGNDTVKIPHGTDRRIKRTIEEFFAHGKDTKASRRPVKAVLVIAAIVLAAVLCMSVGSIRTRIVNVFKTSFEKYDQYDFTVNGEMLSEVGFLEPSYVPKGFTREVQIKNKNMLLVLYKLDDEPVVYYSQYAGINSTMAVDNEHTETKNVNINGYEGTLFRFSDGNLTIAWNNGVNVFQLNSTASGSVTEKQLIKMAKSLKTAKE